MAVKIDSEKCGHIQNYVKKYPYETYEYWEEK